jgi:hypothetical protein
MSDVKKQLETPVCWTKLTTPRISRKVEVNNETTGRVKFFRTY